MGSVYPLWIEKLVFVLIIASGIYAGYALGEYMSGVALLLTRLCGLPLAILFLMEGIGRVIQSTLSK
ncbi:MAG: hypothetical protein CMB57_03805 [Euryarchaeota archaeon]|nr:hypothetical protein [Euryarchaeota archaeon]|tara:strand:+ start:747 stop:947 length:201 start_codon:yes stop_codon:yes gene_type:complete